MGGALSQAPARGTGGGAGEPALPPQTSAQRRAPRPHVLLTDRRPLRAAPPRPSSPRPAPPRPSLGAAPETP